MIPPAMIIGIAWPGFQFRVAAMKAFLLCFVVSLSAILHAETPLEMTEFANRTAVKFSSKDHPKALGLTINIKRPSSWLAENGERPHVVQKFTSNKGLYVVTASLMVRTLPNDQGGEATGEQILASLEPEELKKGLPSGMDLWRFAKLGG